MKLASSACLLFLAILSTSVHSDPSTEKFRESLARRYAAEVAEEFNALQTKGDLKGIYQYFVAPNERTVFFNRFSRNLRFRAKGTQIEIVGTKTPTINMEIKDLIQQQFVLNGKAYAHDWNSPMQMQRDRIQGMFRASQARAPRNFNLLEYALPRAEAVVPLLILAADLCLEGGCEAAAFAAQRSFLFVAENSGEIISVSRLAASMAGRAGARGAEVAVQAVKYANQALSRVGQFIVEDFKSDTEIATYLSKSKTLLKPTTYVKAPIKATVYIFKLLNNQVIPQLFGAGTGLAMYLLYKNVDDYTNFGIARSDAIKCILSNTNKENCKSSTLKVSVQKTLLVPDDELWCPTATVNEIHTTDKTADGLLVRVVRMTVDKDGNGTPDKAYRYELDAHEHFLAGSLRSYGMEGSDITEIRKPFENAGEFVGSTMRIKQLKNALVENTITDMQNQVVRRERALARAGDTSQDVIVATGKTITGFKDDELKVKSDPEFESLTKEVHLAQNMKAYVDSKIKWCNDLQGHGVSKATGTTTAEAAATSK